MDRVQVYPGAIPLETDLLNAQKNDMIGLAKLSAAVLGTSTQVNGLPCTQNTIPALNVLVGPGEIYSLQNIDGTAYSSLAADTAHQILKQGIALDAVVLSAPAPGTAGMSINYLVQVQYQDSDTNAVVLPYYNASNPAVAYSGPANAGTTNNTMRKGLCTVAIKTGIAATTGTQVTPSADAGYVGLYVVTVANGQASVLNANISIYAGAPFIETEVSSFNALQLADYTALRAYSGMRKSVYVTGYLISAAPSGISGMFIRDDHDTTTADNGGTIIVSASGVRWKRPAVDGFRPEMFGAAYDGVTDDSTAWANVVAAAAGNFIYAPAGTAMIGTSIELSNSADTSQYRKAPKIIGKGIGVTRFLNRSGGPLFKHTQTSGQGAVGSYSRGLKLSGFDIYVDGSSPTGSRGFAFSGAYYPEIADVLMYGLKGNGVETLNYNITSSSDLISCATITMNRVTITACLGWGVLSTAYSNSYRLNDCYLTANYGGFCAVGSAHVLSGGAVAGNYISGNTGATSTVSSITWSSGVVTVVTSGAHGLTNGDAALINDNTTTAWCGVHSVTVTNSTTFTYPLYTNPGSTGGTTTVMQLSGGIIFAYQGGNQNMNCIATQVEIQVNAPRQIWIQGQNCTIDRSRILDDDQGTATFHSPVQVDIGGVQGALSDDNKVINCLYRLTSASGTPAVTLMRNNLNNTGGARTARRNRLMNPGLAATGAPVITYVSLANPTNKWGFGSGQSMYPEAKAIAYTTSNTAISATPNSIMSFDTLVYDTYSNYSTVGGGSFTAPFSGFLNVQVHSNISSPVTAKSYTLSILKNGTTVQDFNFEFTTPTGVLHRDLINAVATVPCALGDVFQIALWADDVGGAGAVYCSSTESNVTYTMIN